MSTRPRSFSGPLSGAFALLILAQLWWRAGALPGSGPFLVEDGRTLWDAMLLAFFFGGHSILAAHSIKRAVGLAPDAYRRFYLSLTLLTAAVLSALWSPLPRPIFWELAAPWSWGLHALQGLGLAGLVWTARHFDLGAFFGAKDADAGRLSERGPYAMCRHPTYFFTLLLLVSPLMPAGRALLAGAAALYILVGCRIEERKLLVEWGEPYARYRARTPGLMPTPRSLRAALGSRQNV